MSDPVICIDIGNTAGRCAVILGHRILGSARSVRPKKAGAGFWKTLVRTALANAGLKGRRRFGAVICSVVPAQTRPASDALRSYCAGKPLVVSPADSTLMKTRCRNPGRLGPDRYCAAAAARTHGLPVIAVDCGTAITIDYVSAAGGHEGGVILPGMRTAAASLRSATAALPYVADVGAQNVGARAPRSYPGRDTNSAITLGILVGTSGAIAAHISMLKKTYRREGKPVVVGTGGDAKRMPKNLFDVVDEFLVLRGAALYYDRVTSPRRATRR